MDQDQWLGGYRLIRRLGSGGAGTVWLAEDEGGQRVALKLLHPALADTTKGRARLAREATTVNLVRSSGVAHVLDVETDGVQPFVVTEFVEGPTLAVRLRSGALGSRDVAALGQSLRATLQAVHDAHVVHRDVKPSNVILHPTGPVLIDFGIAMGEDDERLTSTGLVSGTAGYTAPEVLRGGEANQATDWWSWAATLLETAHGRPPFGGGDSRAVMLRVLEGDPDLAGLPVVVANAFSRALAVDMSTRPDPCEVVDLLSDPTNWRGDRVDPDPTSGRAEILSQTTGTATIDAPGQATELLPPAQGESGPVTEARTSVTEPPLLETRTLPTGAAPGWTALPPTSSSPATSPETAWPTPVAPGPPPSTPVAGQAGIAPSGLSWVPILPYVARRPRTTLGSGLVLLAALAALPAMAEGPGTVIALIVVALLSVLGAGVSWRERRRVRFGSVRSSDTGMSVLAMPLHILRAITGELVGLVVGVIVASAVWVLALRTPSEPLTWPFDLVTEGVVPSEAFDYTNSLRVLTIIWGLSAIVLLVMWCLPTGRNLRDGTSVVVRILLPPVWSRIVFCVIVVAILVLTWFVVSGGRL